MLGWVATVWLASTAVTGAAAPATSPAAATAATLLNYASIFVDDTWHVFSAPARFSARDWRLAAAALGGLVVIGAYDRPLLDAVQRKPLEPVAKAARFVEPVGRRVPTWCIVGFYTYGAVARSEKAAKVAVDLAATSLIASNMITPALKASLGRSRPRDGDGTYRFRPFSGHESLPSADVTAAFGLVSVLTAHYPAWWVQLPAYSTAALVAFGRVRKNAHFPSDTALGALVGASVGKSVVRFNEDRRVRFIVRGGATPSVLVAWIP